MDLANLAVLDSHAPVSTCMKNQWPCVNLSWTRDIAISMRSSEQSSHRTQLRPYWTQVDYEMFDQLSDFEATTVLRSNILRLAN
jgi:hypothetical protein